MPSGSSPMSRRAYKPALAIREEELLWLEISEFPDRPKVLVRAYRSRRNRRWEVEFFDDGTSVIVPEERLYREVTRPEQRPVGAETPLLAPIATRDVSTLGPKEFGPEKGKEDENGEGEE